MKNKVTLELRECFDVSFGDYSIGRFTVESTWENMAKLVNEKNGSIIIEKKEDILSAFGVKQKKNRACCYSSKPIDYRHYQ